MGKIRPLIPEPQLVAALQSRDKQSLVYLYDHYSAALYGVIVKIVRVEEIAEDILQDTFVKVWRNIDSYNPQKGTLFTWLLNIARNTAIDRIRTSEYRQRVQIQSVEQAVHIPTEEDGIEAQTDFIGVDKVVETLRPEQQVLIDLLYFQGYTQTEAAEALNVPLGTVKTRIRAALLQLRQLITN